MFLYIDLQTDGWGRYSHQETSIAYETTPHAFASVRADVIPETLRLLPWIAPVIENGVVISVTDNVEARVAWEARPKPPPEPTTEETLLELAADHEYRLCMQELGLN